MRTILLAGAFAILALGCRYEQPATLPPADPYTEAEMIEEGDDMEERAEEYGEALEERGEEMEEAGEEID